MRAILLFLASVCLGGCQSHVKGVVVQLLGAAGARSPEISAEVAATPSSRQIGLMYRKTLGETDGMLFVFPKEEPLSFWMRNTYVELDIIYLDKGLKVVSVVHRAVPLTETPRPSGKPAQYVLEVVGGSAKRWGVEPGWNAVIQGELPNAIGDSPSVQVVENPE